MADTSFQTILSAQRDRQPASAGHVRPQPEHKTDRSKQPGIGAWCREVYRRSCLRPKSLFDPASPLGQRVLIPAYYGIRLAFFTIRDWRPLYQQRGIGLLRQMKAQWTLMHRYRIDPSVYYSSQLYELPRGLAACEDYVGRDEIKNGLMKQLHWLQPKVYGKRVSLGDKALFTRHCVEAGLPVARVIAVVSRGTWEFTDGSGHKADFRSLDRDIFIKPLWGRGARGTEWFTWVGKDRYSDKRGRVLSRAKVLRYLTKRSKKEPLLIQPRLFNHPEIADLARDSLMVFRVFTCLDECQRPHVTHAMLRILSKLEPSWSQNVEYGVRVDLTTGQLDQLCDDYHFAPDDWWDRHPFTGAQVTGRIVTQWPKIAALAKAGHRVLVDRTVIGWDIALTRDGPVIIEGNAYPDTHFLQRVHRQLIGDSPLAPLLGLHLMRLAS
ncbi:MAG TPA: sugar-transfer associated ATP-grasp domain-containing protein [Terriglobales bacterium]|nr:sugar-transfer associated ATP-grasp domain-containing protein [Terriglobales bacterium]